MVGNWSSNRSVLTSGIRVGRLIYSAKEVWENFYLKNCAFIHFHEDPDGLFADGRFAVEFERVPVNSQAEQMTLLDAIRSHLIALSSTIAGKDAETVTGAVIATHSQIPLEMSNSA